MEFQSERLIYRNYVEEDEQYYLQISMDEVLMKYISGNGGANSEADSKKRFQEFLVINKDSSPSGIHIIFHKESLEYVGLSKFVFEKPGQVELGYVIVEKFWGQGMGTEISKRMVQLANETESVEEIIAIVDPKNLASIRILEKSGLQYKEPGSYKGMPSLVYNLMK